MSYPNPHNRDFDRDRDRERGRRPDSRERTSYANIDGPGKRPRDSYYEGGGGYGGYGGEDDRRRSEPPSYYGGGGGRVDHYGGGGGSRDHDPYPKPPRRDSRDYGGGNIGSGPPSRDYDRYGGGGSGGREGGSRDVYGGPPDRREDRGTYGERSGGYRDDKGDRGGRGGYGGDKGRGEGAFGGGRGGRFSGGPAGGRGGRGGNRKPHMGELPEVIELLRSASMSDEAVLSVIDPPVQEKDREELVVMSRSEDLKAEYNIRNNSQLSTLTTWRRTGQLGVFLDNKKHVVRANYFPVNADALPKTIYNYRVGIFRIDRDKPLRQEDDLCNKKGESGLTTQLLRALIKSHTEWHVDSRGENVGFAYNGASTLYTTMRLFNPAVEIGDTEDAPQPVSNGFEEEIKFSDTKTYLVILNETAGTRNVPQTLVDWVDPQNFEVLHALDVSLLSFARWEEGKDRPTWVLAGSKVYRTKNGVSWDFSPSYLGRLGYYASLRCTLSGLCMISEVSVGCFLKGGNLVTVMANVGNYRDEADMIKDSKGIVSSGHHDASNGLPRSRLSQMESVLKGAKVKLLHLGHSKKFKSFGPSSDHMDSAFEYDDEQVTVAEYFERMAKSDPRYAAALPSGRLIYPHLPTLNVGTKKHPVLVPVELVFVTEGQSRQRGLPADIANNIIRYAAQAPEERFDNLINKSMQDGVLRSLQDDPNAAAFGLHGVSSKPMKVQACILPPPKLQYGNRVVEPELRGAWNLAGGIRFAHPAKPLQGNAYVKYGLIITYDRSGPANCDFQVKDFRNALEKESQTVGMPLELVQASILTVRGRQEDLDEALGILKNKGAQIVVCLLFYDCYPLLKLVADMMRLPTQCVTWKNFNKPPRNYHTSLLVKMNYKLGGVNHTLASRAPRNHVEEEDNFQSPPKSISWLFDEPCMVMGVDVNHPEIRGAKDINTPSVVAVVGSTDRMLGQYCTKISAVTSPKGTDEPVQGLSEVIGAVLDTFFRRNKRFPKRIIVYRDGVADNQFNDVIKQELFAYKEALNLRGYNEDSVKLAIIICQKRHQTRLVYENGENDFRNPCVGLCVDARTSLGDGKKGGAQAPDEEVGSINATNLNEFYLNSHAAVLGTSKPCKYTLIYDEIGMKLTELELMTFWMTHLYARCTRSVSYATPAYYAHWAAKRGRFLLTGGAKLDDLASISENYNQGENSMFFV